MAFLTLALAQLWNVFNARQPGSRLLRDGEIRNPFVWGALALCLLLLAAALWLPGLAAVLSLPTPGLSGLLLATWNWFVPFLAPALAKPYAAAAGPSGPGILSASLILPLLAAVAGWAVACMLQARQGKFHAVSPARFKRIYVVLLNKLYFDEIFNAFAVRPTLRFAGWLWQAVEIRRIDRLVHAVATTSVGMAGWLWDAVEVRRIDQNVERFGHLTAATGRGLEDIGARNLQHHLLVLIFWLMTAIGLFYWLVL
mgnify:CR=1 FL=1